MDYNDRLHALKDDKEAFDVALETCGWLLDDLEDTLAPGECEESYRGSGKVLEWLRGYINDALELAPAFTTPEDEAKLRAASAQSVNLRIKAWQCQQDARREMEATQNPAGKTVCPAMFALTGAKSVLEGGDFCNSGECPYQAQCEAEAGLAPAAP